MSSKQTQMTDNVGSTLELLKSSSSANYRSTFAIDNDSMDGTDLMRREHDEEIYLRRQSFRALATIFVLFLAWLVIYPALMANHLI